MDGAQVGQLDIERLAEVAIVRLLGEHDLSSASSLRQTLCALADEGRGIVADLGDTEFIDLAVIRALLAADEALDGSGRRLALLIGPQAATQRLFQLTGLGAQFALAQDRLTAIELARERHHREGQPAQ